jgi:hypothetical protein
LSSAAGGLEARDDVPLDSDDLLVWVLRRGVILSRVLAIFPQIWSGMASGGGRFAQPGPPMVGSLILVDQGHDCALFAGGSITLF